MTRRCLTGCAATILALAGAFGPGVASGAPPTFERIEVDDTFVDEQLSEACGVEALVHLEGHITLRTFSGEQTGVAQVNSINFGATITGGGGTFRLRDVGADVTRIEPDGTAVLLISGQVPFEFAGVLTIDLETGEAILEPRNRTEQQVAKACAAFARG